MIALARLQPANTKPYEKPIARVMKGVKKAIRKFQSLSR